MPGHVITADAITLAAGFQFYLRLFIDALEPIEAEIKINDTFNSI